MAKAAIEQTFEFDESELYHDERAVHLADEMSEEGQEAVHPGSESDSDFQPEFDKLSADGDGDSESSRSASLQVSLQDIDSQDHSPPEHFSKPALGTTYTKAIYNPRPVASTRLGTSAPINIPHMSRWKLGTSTEGGAVEQEPSGGVPHTFIPPHQLSQKDDFMFSFTGASPSAVLKRDRLRQRNAILRSTGFLELGAVGGPAAAAARAAAAAAAAAAQQQQQQETPRTAAQSSLTAALSTIGEC